MAASTPTSCIPPITAYYVMKIGKLPLLPYFRPGDLAWPTPSASWPAATRRAARQPWPGCRGKDLEAAVYATEELEETAKLFLLLRSVPTRPLNRAQIDELKTAFKLDR